MREYELTEYMNGKLREADRNQAEAKDWNRIVRAELEQPLTSFVSYPERCPLFGDGRFRGNCDGRLFLSLVWHYKALSVADPMMGSGTTKDGVNWLNAQYRGSIDYWGGDLSSGFDATAESPPGEFDLVWLHPPYWDIITYSDNPRDLSAKVSYVQYLSRLFKSLAQAAKAVRPGGHLAVLLGDIRRRGNYFNPAWEIWAGGPPGLGCLASVIIKAQHACGSDRVGYASLPDPRIMHETCLVFERLAI